MFEIEIKNYQDLLKQQIKNDKTLERTRSNLRLLYHELETKYPNLGPEIKRVHKTYSEQLTQASSLSVQVNKARKTLLAKIEGEII